MNVEFLMDNLFKRESGYGLKVGDMILREQFEDPDYLDFTAHYCNGGFFFDRSLMLYSHKLCEEYFQLTLVNDVFAKEFESLFDGLISFGQDLFGNQFCFERGSNRVLFFQIETGDKKVIANSFVEWIALLEKDWEYYSAYPYLKRWLDNNTLRNDERICAKKPFVIGGEYHNNNFYALSYPNYILYNGSIAKQLKSLQDGSKVVLKIVPPQ